jgi:peptide deformylase
MAVRPILLFGDPRLEAPNEEVDGFGSELHELIEDLFETSWRAPGLGLAAPQVGVNLSLAVVDLSIGEDPDARIVLANPEILESRGKVSLEEGCLSFPGLFTTIVRPRSLRLRARDRAGESFELEAEGLLAQAICHERDHLDGRLLVHHLRGLKRRMFLRRVAKMRDSGVWPKTA